MANFKKPTQNQIISSDGIINRDWDIFLTQVNNYITENSQHGITANRPTTNLYVGRYYLDDTLGYTVHIASLNPTVWKNEAGAVV